MGRRYHEGTRQFRKVKPSRDCAINLLLFGLFSVWNIDQRHHFFRSVRVHEHLITDVVTATLKLNDIANLQKLQVHIAEALLKMLAVTVGHVFNVIFFFDLWLCDDVIVFDELHGYHFRNLCQPCELRALLEVRIVRQKRATHGVHVHGVDLHVAPIHQGHDLAFLERRRVFRFKQNLVRIQNGLRPDIRVLLVLWHCTRIALWCAGNRHRDGARLRDGGVSRCDGVDDAFVDGPNFVPFHERGVDGEPLRKNERAKSADGHTAAQDTLHGGKARVVPTVDDFLIDKPLKLPL
mmetsp:Transcript_17222/g.43989  ORF Transcript_17222/g.43989 Transcript_17222/m.43989 type:complete len:293 (-) Transcript_17222:801-1679(-)